MEFQTTKRVAVASITITHAEGEHAGLAHTLSSWEEAGRKIVRICSDLPVDLIGYIKLDVEAQYTDGFSLRFRFDATPFGDRHEGSDLPGVLMGWLEYVAHVGGVSPTIGGRTVETILARYDLGQAPCAEVA